MAQADVRSSKAELSIFKHFNTLLRDIRNHSLSPPDVQSKTYIFLQCCKTLKKLMDCRFIWAGYIDDEHNHLGVMASAPPVTSKEHPIQHHLALLLTKQFGTSLQEFIEPVYLFINAEKPDMASAENHYCLVWPVSYQNRNYGFIAMHCARKDEICTMNQEVIASVIDEVALALFSQDNFQRLEMEYDFNKEILDTIQALMVTIRPCGTILSFNRQAELVTGYKESEVIDKYWVDVLIAPYNRNKFQQLFSMTLREDEANIHFKAPLISRDGTEHFISWHRSIRHEIDSARVGLVMIGLDETEYLATDQQLHMLSARWGKIFNAIHDPVLVVANDYTILDANPALCAAARKIKDEVVGRRVCEIVHGGHREKAPCPLEQLIGEQKTRIYETELSALKGTYMLTVTPLVEENEEINATLLVARNLTKEEVVRAEAIRVAQLAAIGELASGVAHEINNPINTIINYAQIILDDPDDHGAIENLGNIISESKRIAGIVTNLLSFARCREELYSPASIQRIISNSIQLIAHLLKRDGINLKVDVQKNLPDLLCNEHQLQQVFLNLLSNARYALNCKYSSPCREKLIQIVARLLAQGETQFIRLTFTDYGIGIAREIQGRIFDPFFSTKPKGEGTGLGLSVSYGLVKDHEGDIRMYSETDVFTSFVIDLPVKQC